MKGIFFVILTFILGGCIDEQTATPDIFFDVDSLVDSQLDYLINNPVKIEKSGTIASSSEVQVMEPDSLQWTRELAIFKRVDINKPRLKEIYEISETQLSNNHLLKTYKPVNDKSVPVRILSLEFKGTDIVSLSAKIRDSNVIYASERTVTMLFDDVKGERRISSYTVTGGQKMKLKDSVLFDVAAKILY